MSATYPDDLLYTKDHEWARVEDKDGQKLVTVGISRFAVDQLGEHLGLGDGGGQLQGGAEPDVGGHRLGDQRLERGRAEHGQHRGDVLGVGADVAGGELVLGREIDGHRG